MTTIRAIFTKRLHPASLAIRCANPVSFVRMAPASHVVIVDGDTGYAIQATYGKGVFRAPLKEALHKLTIVKEVDYYVPNAEAGLAWLRETSNRGAKYDWKGALGLGLAPTRNWQDDSDWFCFELLAMALAMGGRDIFRRKGHVTAHMLLSVIP